YAGSHLLAVADGMGGAPAGDLASAVAVSTLRRLDTKPPEDEPAENLLEALAGAIHRANDRLAELIEDDAGIDGMGTTVTAALFDGTHIGVAHLGDSRGYLWRDGELLRISHDHSWVQSLIDEGRITEEEAKVHSHRSLLLKVLDGRHDNDPDLTLYDVQAGDRILICSDGLSSFLPPDRIERVMSIGTAESVSAELTQLALEAGSNDNVTVVVGDVVDEPATDAEPLVVGAAGDHRRGPLSRLRIWAHRDDAEPGEILMEDPDLDPEELRYAPRAPRRFLWLRRSAVLVVALAILAVAAVVGYRWTQTQYYVAAYDDHVAIYQGVEANLPGISLHHVYAAQDIELSELPSFRRDQVLDGMAADSLDEAHHIVGQLQTFAHVCAEQAQQNASRTTTQPTRTTHHKNKESPPPHKRGTTGPHRTRGNTKQGPTGGQTKGPSPQGPSGSAGTSASPGRDTSSDSNNPDTAECAGSTPQTSTTTSPAHTSPGPDSAATSGATHTGRTSSGPSTTATKGESPR
ncbi:MAG: PP2C family protein-serine/threonine phosphatase, partial [Nocardioidaceae bacterium]